MPSGKVDATERVERSAVNEVVAGTAQLEALMSSGRLAVEGDPAKLGERFGLLAAPDPDFAIVTPNRRRPHG